MHVIWNPAVTLDGYIARPDGDSNWITESEGEACLDLIRQCGCAVVGRTTFDMDAEFFAPVRNQATLFVWTHHTNKPPETGVEYVSGSPADVLHHIEQLGFQKTVLVGGSKTNTAFAAAGLINEILVTVYPLLFGAGIKLVDGAAGQLSLIFQDCQPIADGIVRQHYFVRKS